MWQIYPIFDKLILKESIVLYGEFLVDSNKSSYTDAYANRYSQRCFAFLDFLPIIMRNVYKFTAYRGDPISAICACLDG